MSSKKLLQISFLVGDIFLMYLALLSTLALRYGDFSFWPGPQTRIFLWHFTFIHLIWIFLLFLLDFYEVSPLKKISNFSSNLIIFLFSAGATGTIYFYLNPKTQIYPKTILALDVFIFGIFLSLWRYLLLRLLKLRNFREKIVILGFKPELEELIEKYLPFEVYEILAFFTHNSSLIKELNFFSNFVKYGTLSNIDKLREIIKKENINSIVLALDLHKDEKLVREIFSHLPLKINYISFPDFYETLTKKVPIEAINEVWFLENLSRVERKIDEIFKRGFDILFSFFGLLVLAILFPFIALAIKIDSPGPIFYSQKRVGKGRKIFTLYKFRTLKESPNQDKEVWREKDESQVTRVGRFLRRTHLDELPQFWSILKGDLSFVGPRPEWVKLAQRF
jgi:hypothetical protein